MIMSYEEYENIAPPGKLKEVLRDEEHLSLIADELDEQEMVNKLCPVLGLKSQPDVRDIKRKYKDDLAEMRY